MSKNQHQNVETHEELSEVLKVRREKLQNLIDMGRNPFEQTKYDVTDYSMQIKDNFEAKEGETVKIAGRIMSKRIQGKAGFIDIQDSEGRIQCYVRKDAIGEEEYPVFKTYDIGDIIGVEGTVFKTKKEEISVKATSVVLLSKSLQVLPEKYHGLKDVDLRYRQRYVDLIVNPEVKQAFLTRTKALKALRSYLDDRGFLEVETPILNTIAGGANARPFITHHNTLDIPMYLRIANELYLKRLIVGGFDKVYEMGRMFRNEGMDRNHNPEFTSMECYAAYGDMELVIEVTEQVVYKAAMAVNGSPIIKYQGKEFDVTPPWKRIDMTDFVCEVTGIDFHNIADDETARAEAIKYGMDKDEVKNWTRGKIIAEMFEEYCEDLPGVLDGSVPVFVTGHPVEISPLAKRSEADPRITRRFEGYINGWEICNGFSELNDPIDQYERFAEQQAQLDAGLDEEAHPMDMDFVNALEVGLPPTGGLGIGIDRVIMLIADAPSIRDIILFPTMKPIGAEKKTDAESKRVRVLDKTKIEVEPLFEEYVDFDSFAACDFRAVKIKECTAVAKSKKLLKFVLNDGSGTDRIILSGIHEYYEPEELVGKTAVAITNLPPRKMMGEESNGMLLSCVNKYDGEEMLNFILLDDQIPAGAKVY